MKDNRTEESECGIKSKRNGEENYYFADFTSYVALRKQRNQFSRIDFQIPWELVFWE